MNLHEHIVPNNDKAAMMGPPFLVAWPPNCTLLRSSDDIDMKKFCSQRVVSPDRHQPERRQSLHVVCHASSASAPLDSDMALYMR